MRITYANAMSTVAVFLAMGGAGAVAATHLGRASVGGEQLKANAVTGAKVKNASLTGDDIAASTLAKVPAAAHADAAANADHATDARRADSAARADTATTAANATTATRATTAAALTPDEAVHFLGEPGEPEDVGSFKELTKIGFYRDHEGVVHLQGHLLPTVDNAGLLAYLPPTYGPAQVEVFFGVTPKSSARVLVEPSGRVEILGAAKEELVSLDGIAWRTGG